MRVSCVRHSNQRLDKGQEGWTTPTASDLRSPSITGSDPNFHSTCGTLRASSRAYRSLHFATGLPSQQLRTRHHGDIHSRPFVSNGACVRKGWVQNSTPTARRLMSDRGQMRSPLPEAILIMTPAHFDLCRFRMPQRRTLLTST